MASQNLPSGRITSISGKGIAVRGDNIDTDRIYPGRFMIIITFAGCYKYAFYDERFDSEGKQMPHPFNDLRNAGASILVVNKNFGCGSSREHAPQSLMRHGIRAIAGESFGEIFAGNCARLGIPAVTLAHDEIAKLMDFAENPDGGAIEISLEKGEARFGEETAKFSMPESRRRAFVEGNWDSTALLLEAKEQIWKTADGLAYLKFRRGVGYS